MQSTTLNDNSTVLQSHNAIFIIRVVAVDNSDTLGTWHSFDLYYIAGPVALRLSIYTQPPGPPSPNSYVYILVTESGLISNYTDVILLC